MKTQKFLCIDLDVNTQSSGLLVGEGRNGMLTMTEDGEHFVFEEGLTSKPRRNAKLWSGHRINVKRNIFGQLCVHFRRLEMTKELNAKKVANEIQHELEAAKEELGV